jgi:hypothetical protein
LTNIHKEDEVFGKGDKKSTQAAQKSAKGKMILAPVNSCTSSSDEERISIYSGSFDRSQLKEEGFRFKTHTSTKAANNTKEDDAKYDLILEAEDVDETGGAAA